MAVIQVLLFRGNYTAEAECVSPIDINGAVFEVETPCFQSISHYSNTHLGRNGSVFR